MKVEIYINDSLVADYAQYSIALDRGDIRGAHEIFKRLDLNVKMEILQISMACKKALQDGERGVSP